MSDIKKSKEVIAIILQNDSYKTKDNPKGIREFPKDQALRLLKNVAMQKGYRNTYKVVKKITQ